MCNAQTVTLEGIVSSTDSRVIPKRVRDGLYKETYEQAERILIRAALQKGDRVLEVGGGVGFVSLLCAKICGVENVLTYEANPAMDKIIRGNFELNGLKPNLRNKAVTADGKDVTFFLNDNIVSSSLYSRKDSKPSTLPSDALDTVIAEWKPTVIVMDAEGGEVEILGTSPLTGVKKLVLELHPHVVGVAAIQKLVDYLATLGFRETQRVDKSATFLRA